MNSSYGLIRSAATCPLPAAEEQIRELDHLSSLHRVVEPNGAATRRARVSTDTTGEQISDSLSFATLCVRIAKHTPSFGLKALRNVRPRH